VEDVTDVEERGTPRRFRPVVDSRAYEHVIDQLVFGIRSGEYTVGERLPAIGELARQFGVSKPTVGEAVRILSRHGVVASKRGVTGGVTVTRDDIPTALLGLVPERRLTDLRDLVEARRPIEMELARLASRRALESDFVSMQESIERLEEHVGDPQLRLHYDHLFHYAMARAADSDLLAHYQHQILKQLVVLLTEYFAEQEDPVLVIELHKRTLRALRSRRERAVDRIMDEHLSSLEQVVGLRERAHDPTPAR
jgi:GntR family transcriptional repressor for pyruvate dehydrogenase complex